MARHRFTGARTASSHDVRHGRGQRSAICPPCRRGGGCGRSPSAALVGPPGAGKTMLAERLPSLLPHLDDETALAASCVQSVVGAGVSQLVRRPPFRAPHHTASLISMIGGGSSLLRPGEVSRAHGGVLFLDELGEHDRRARCVAPAAGGTSGPGEPGGRIGDVPASFILMAATNPCPCGYTPSIACTCGPAAIARYRRRLSGPLLDRFDLRLVVSAASHREVVDGVGGETSAAIAQRMRALANVPLAEGSRRGAQRRGTRRVHPVDAVCCGTAGESGGSGASLRAWSAAGPLCGAHHRRSR